MKSHILSMVGYNPQPEYDKKCQKIYVFTSLCLTDFFYDQKNFMLKIKDFYWINLSLNYADFKEKLAIVIAVNPLHCTGEKSGGDIYAITSRKPSYQFWRFDLIFSSHYHEQSSHIQMIKLLLILNI